MRTLLTLMMCFALISCKKNTLELRNTNGISFDTDIYLFVKDSNGKDLLNPSNPDAFLRSNINYFQISNGKKVEILDAGKCQIVKLDTKTETIFCLKLSCNYTNYIEWPNGDTDILECTMNTSHGFSIVTASYNGKLIDFTNQYNLWRAFTIAKK